MKHLLTLFALLLTSVTFGQEACPAPIDVNSNGAVDIADFLNVLGLFGDVDSDGDGVWDSQDLCVDTNACNFQANQSEYCQYLDAVGVCGGGCESDEDSDGVCDFLECGDPKTYQGDHYATVLIGDQCWFAENLRSETYQNGDSIDAPEILADWSTTTEGAITIYGRASWPCGHYSTQYDLCDEDVALEGYGRLYNNHAVEDPRNLCPSGWHVPLDEEWSALMAGLGGAAAHALKSSEGWHSDNNGSNSSGFTALPTGILYSNGWSAEGGIWGFWQAKPHEEGYFYMRRMTQNGMDRILHFGGGLNHGLAVRCIQDSE
jgi:uncharacterized protein (TIGR02145 family)